MNVSSKQNCFASATRISVKTSGNMSAEEHDHMKGNEEEPEQKCDVYMTYLDRHNSNVDSAYDEMDEGCTLLLDEYVSDNDNPSDNNVSGSNVGVNTGYDKINGDWDGDYISYLDTHKSYIDSACDEMHEDCTLFLAEYVSDNDSPSDNDISGSNIDVNTCYNNIKGYRDVDYTSYLEKHNSYINSARDEIDEDCILFLEEYVSDIDSPSDNDVGGSNVDANIGYNNIEDVDNISYLEKHNSYINSARDEMDEDGNHGILFLDEYVSDIVSPSDNDVSGSNIDVNTGYSNIKDVDYISYLEKHNSDINSVCDEMDEDCTLFLDKYVADDESDLLSSSGKNTTEAFMEKDGSDSSGSDLIILEYNSIRENTSLVSSKTYDLSFFEEEGSPRDGRQLCVDDHSSYRRRLMENLGRPYDHLEYIELQKEVCRKRKQERQFETRGGVVKSYHTKAVNKSYLELHPDLGKAITKLKAKRPKVLFLLRGFFFWLQNLAHDDGVFQPWCDKSCLETLRKM